MTLVRLSDTYEFEKRSREYHLSEISIEITVKKTERLILVALDDIEFPEKIDGRKTGKMIPKVKLTFLGNGEQFYTYYCDPENRSEYVNKLREDVAVFSDKFAEDYDLVGSIFKNQVTWRLAQ